MDLMAAVLILLSCVIIVLLILVYTQYRRIKQLTERVSRDPLTGLLNRRAFEPSFQKLLSLLGAPDDQRRTGPLSALSVFFIDLDHFKRINDTYGHAVGDEVLRVVSLAITRALRTADLICRYGGEEIVVVLPGVTNSDALVVAEKLRRTVADLSFSIPDLRVTMSLGVCTTTHYAKPEVLLSRADAAVYEAKEHGRDQVVVG